VSCQPGFNANSEQCSRCDAGGKRTIVGQSDRYKIKQEKVNAEQREGY